MSEINFNIAIDDLMKAGIHIGHSVSKLHPKMKNFISGIKNTSHIIDLEQTKKCLIEALNYIKELFKPSAVLPDGGIGNREPLLLVGTKPPFKKMIEETAIICDIPYVTERWLGGTFTNFDIVSKRIKHLKELEEKEKKGEFEKYTKYERIKIRKEISDLGRKFGGLKKLENFPKAVFICDIVKDKLCLKEAKEKNIKTIAIVHTNADPTLVDFPIPANDDAISSVRYILEKVKEVILKEKK